MGARPMTNVFRDCDADRTKYDNAVGYVDFQPKRGLLIVEEFGKPVTTVRGTPSYIYFLHSLTKAMRAA